MQKCIIDAQKSMNVISTNTKGIRVDEINLDKKIKQYSKGHYLVVNYSLEYLQKKALVLEGVLNKTLKKFFKDKDLRKILVIGLGNPNVLGDTLGIKVTNKMIATNQYNFLTIPKVILFNPNVVNNTGINSFELIKALVNKEKPSMIIIIDSLCSKNASVLNQAIEINDCGIIPSANLSINKNISYETFKIPLIFIGVPLLWKVKKNYYTDYNILEVLETTSEILAKSLMKAIM